jgi:hypothetical protein
VKGRVVVTVSAPDLGKLQAWLGVIEGRTQGACSRNPQRSQSWQSSGWIVPLIRCGNRPQRSSRRRRWRNKGFIKRKRIDDLKSSRRIHEVSTIVDSGISCTSFNPLA